MKMMPSFGESLNETDCRLAFPIAKEEQFGILKFTQAKCFDTSSVKFTGSQGEGDFFIDILKFSVVKCTNKTICKSQKQIDEALKLYDLFIGVSQNYVDFDSFDQPIKTQISFKKISLDDQQ